MHNLENHKPDSATLNNNAQGDVFVVYKKEGETPLECLNRLKEEGFLPSRDKFTYAGRLDPMAEGLLIFLRGESIKNKHDYLSLEKEYEVEVLLGVGTDTGDILGLINTITKSDVVFDLKNIQNICESFVGKLEVPYPWFSSKPLNGKPLHEWAREFASEEETEEEKDDLLRPMTKLDIKEIEFLGLSLISNNNLHREVVNRIKKVVGDFRQEKIILEWDKISTKNLKHKKTEGETSYPILKIRVKCGSGSYMRTLAELMGERLKVPALAYSIKRISIGKYKA